MQPIEKKACNSHGWQQEPIGKKLALEFFCKTYLWNSNGFFISSVFLFFIISHRPLKRLALFIQSYFN